MTEKLMALKSKTLEDFRNSNFITGEAIWNIDYRKYVLDNPDYFVETRIDLEILPVLKWGSGKQRGEFDKENSKNLYKALSHLSAVEAADERLWVSLSLGHFSEYLHNRWPLGKNTDIDTHLNNHVFAPDTRRRFRDQALARLWWVGRFVNRNLSQVEDKAYAVLFDIEADVLSQFTTRPTLVSVSSLANAVVEVSHEAFINPSSMKKRTYDRGRFRDFLKEIDLESGRQLVPHRDYESILIQVQESFDKNFPAGS
jgi:hypothetical protein